MGEGSVPLRAPWQVYGFLCQADTHTLSRCPRPSHPLTTPNCSVACRGALLEEQHPYRAADAAARCPPTATARARAGVAGWSRVGRTSLEMRRALYHAPVVVTLKAGAPAFYGYSAGVLDCSRRAQWPDHAVAVVAYEADVLMPSGERWDVFTIKNSWGGGWGEGGYVRVRDCAARPVGERTVIGAQSMYYQEPLLPRRG